MIHQAVIYKWSTKFHDFENTLKNNLNWLCPFILTSWMLQVKMTQYMQYMIYMYTTFYLIHISEVASLSNFLSQFKHLQANDTNCFLTIKFASHFFFVFLLYYPFKITLLWYEAAQVVNLRTTWLEWGWNFPSERLFYSHWTVLLSPEYEG